MTMSFHTPLDPASQTSLLRLVRRITRRANSVRMVTSAGFDVQNYHCFERPQWLCAEVNTPVTTLKEITHRAICPSQTYGNVFLVN